MAESVMRDTVLGNETKILTTHIESLSLPEINEKLETEGEGSIRVKWITHPDIPDKYFRKLIDSRPEKGTYRFNLDLVSKGKSYKDQLMDIAPHWEFPHPSALVQAAIIYNELSAHGKPRFLSSIWSRSGVRSSITFFAREIRCHARVGFITPPRDIPPCYYVDFFFPDESKERSQQTGVIRTAKVRK